jgi:hypothetical protein
VGGKRRQFAHEAAERGAGGGEDDDGIVGHDFCSLRRWNPLNYNHHMMRCKKCNVAGHDKLS